jgi:hypothetical protein
VTQASEHEAALRRNNINEAEIKELGSTQRTFRIKSRTLRIPHINLCTRPLSLLAASAEDMDDDNKIDSYSAG